MKMQIAAAVLTIALGALSASAQAPQQSAFQFYEPGALVGASEHGLAERKVRFSNLAFPVRFDAASEVVVLNSQMYSPGGACYHAPCSWSADDGVQSDRRNFQYPWRDTFCERAGRGNRRNPACTADPQSPHQGVDIRPPSHVPGRYEALAVTDGIIVVVQRHVVKLRTADGVTFIYRHLDPGSIAVTEGSGVLRGQTIGRIANVLGVNRDGTVAHTTTHLHLEAWQPGVNGDQPWPLYSSLLVAYADALGAPLQVGQDGLLVRDPARELAP